MARDRNCYAGRDQSRRVQDVSPGSMRLQSGISREPEMLARSARHPPPTTNHLAVAPTT